MSQAEQPRGRDLFEQFQSGRPAGAVKRQADDLPSRPEEVLRHIALVLHLARCVKESMAGGQGHAQDVYP